MGTSNLGRKFQDEGTEKESSGACYIPVREPVFVLSPPLHSFCAFKIQRGEAGKQLKEAPSPFLSRLLSLLLV